MKEYAIHDSVKPFFEGNPGWHTTEELCAAICGGWDLKEHDTICDALWRLSEQEILDTDYGENHNREGGVYRLKDKNAPITRFLAKQQS